MLGSDTVSKIMASLKVFLVLAFVHCVFSGQILKKHCKPGSEDYAACVIETLEDYFRKHSEGFPEHDFKAVDPITVPEIIHEDKRYKATYKNIKITGFKDVVFTDVKIVENEGRAEFAMKFNMVADGEIITETTNGKIFDGTFKYEGSVKGDSKYSFTEKKVNNDVVVYNMGPETITCEASNIKNWFNQEMLDAFINDPDNKAIREEYKKKDYAKEYNERIACKIATVVFKEAIDVLRTMGQKGV